MSSIISIEKKTVSHLSKPHVRRALFQEAITEHRSFDRVTSTLAAGVDPLNDRKRHLVRI